MLPYMVKGLYRHDEVKDLEKKDYPGLTGWAQCNHKSSYMRGARGSEFVVGNNDRSKRSG